MRDAATQDRRRNERAKLWICRDVANWRRWRHAPRLTATAVFTDSRHRFSKRWHVADVKNVAGDAQTTLMVHRNSANIACTFHFYVCLRLCDRACSSAADSSGSCHTPAWSYFEEMTRCRRKKFTGDDQATLTVNRNSKIPVCLRLHDRNLSSGGGSTADGGFQRELKRHVTDVKNIAGMTRIDRNSANMKIYAYEIKQNVSKNLFLLLQTTPRLTALRTVYFPAITRNDFCFHIRKKTNFSTILTPPKNRDIHIVEFFVANP